VFVLMLTFTVMECHLLVVAVVEDLEHQAE
jgi:hypothetical protein